jgi:hypothetical protein
MKNIIVVSLFLAALITPSFSQAKEVSVKAIPASMEELVKWRDTVAKTPEGGAAVFLVAMIMFGADNDLGLQAFTLALDPDEVVAGKVYKGFKPRTTWDLYWEQVRRYPFLGRIYVDKTVAADAYALPSGPLVFTFTETRMQADGTAKVFAATTSGNWPRPFTLAKNDKGFWKVKEASSLFAGPSVLPPRSGPEKKPDEL